MNLSKILPPNLVPQFQKIEAFLKNYTKRAYLVGGGVRDIFMKTPIKDLDIEVYDIKEEYFDKLMRKLGAVGVGKSFYVYKYGDIDISLPRTEQKIGIGHQAFDVKLCSDEKRASKRRDFTMNAMMIDIFSGNLLDFYNGLDSIENRTISLIDEKSFKEDSLRVLRAVQFSARLGFKIDERTIKVMDKISLNDLSKTRIFWELEKMFEAQKLYFGLYYFYKLHLFEKIFASRAEKKLFCKSASELIRAENSFEVHLRPYYFLYIVGNILNLDIAKLLKQIEAPRHYIRALKSQPFYDGYISDKVLKEIAIDTPINRWLGNYKKDVKQRAKELGIWDSLFDGGIKVEDVLRDGFEKEEIKKELRRRKLKVINE